MNKSELPLLKGYLKSKDLRKTVGLGFKNSKKKIRIA